MENKTHEHKPLTTPTTKSYNKNNKQKQLNETNHKRQHQKQHIDLKRGEHEHKTTSQTQHANTNVFDNMKQNTQIKLSNNKEN